MTGILRGVSTRFRVRSRGGGRVERTDWYTQKWNEAAARAGWEVRAIGGAFLDLTLGSTRLGVCRSDTSLDTHVSFRLAGDKRLSGKLLVDAGVPTPTIHAVDVTHVRELRTVVERLGGRAVIKPLAGSGGGVGITVSPRGWSILARAALEAASFGRVIAVQERIDGAVVRALVLDGSVIDAVLRTPATVTGDGRSTIRELITDENVRRRKLGPLSTGFLSRTSDQIATMRNAGVNARSVPDAGSTIAVSSLSNTGSERESSRVALSPQSEAMAVAAAHAVGVRLAGVDVIIDPHGRPLAVLEVNTGPGLHWHVLVNNGSFDPFGAILSHVAAR